MAYEPISGKSVRWPLGRVQIRLGPEHRAAYRALYAHYQSILAGLPVLRDQDFDGRPVTVKPAQLAALNQALATLREAPKGIPGSAYASQEAVRSRLFKRLQYLS